MDTSTSILQPANEVVVEDDYLKVKRLENKLAQLDVMEEVYNGNLN